MDLTRARREARLAGGALAGGLAVGLSVAGIGLVALGVTIFLEVVGLLDLGAVPSVGEGLGAGLVLVSVGWFFLGAAWEGLMRHVPRQDAWSRDERAIGWGVSSLAVAVALAVAGSAAGDQAPEVWPGLGKGAGFVEAAGWTGLLVGPVVAAAFWAAERTWPDLIAYERWRVPMLLGLWVGATLWLFTRWGL